MIEIHTIEDLDKVTDRGLKEYLDFSLKRFSDSGQEYFNHTREIGFFVIVTDIEDMMGACIKLSCGELPSMDEILFWEQVELIEMREGVIEVLVVLDADRMISFIFHIDLLDDELLTRVKEFLYE